MPGTFWSTSKQDREMNEPDAESQFLRDHGGVQLSDQRPSDDDFERIVFETVNRESRNYLSTQQLAERVGIDTAQVRQWSSANGLTAHRLGPKLMFPAWQLTEGPAGTALPLPHLTDVAWAIPSDLREATWIMTMEQPELSIDGTPRTPAAWLAAGRDVTPVLGILGGRPPRIDASAPADTATGSASSTYAGPLWRIYRARGRQRVAWNEFSAGDIAGERAKSADADSSAVMTAWTDAVWPFTDAFQRSRVIDPSAGSGWSLAGWMPTRDLRLVEPGEVPGTDVDGAWSRSRAGGPATVILFPASSDSLPAVPLYHQPLSSARAVVAAAAVRLGYGIRNY